MVVRRRELLVDEAFDLLQPRLVALVVLPAEARDGRAQPRGRGRGLHARRLGVLLWCGKTGGVNKVGAVVHIYSR